MRPLLELGRIMRVLLGSVLGQAWTGCATTDEGGEGHGLRGVARPRLCGRSGPSRGADAPLTHQFAQRVLLILRLVLCRSRAFRRQCVGLVVLQRAHDVAVSFRGERLTSQLKIICV